LIYFWESGAHLKRGGGECSVYIKNNHIEGIMRVCDKSSVRNYLQPDRSKISLFLNSVKGQLWATHTQHTDPYVSIMYFVIFFYKERRKTQQIGGQLKKKGTCATKFTNLSSHIHRNIHLLRQEFPL